MKTAVKPNLKSKTFSFNKSYTFSREREINLVNIKFYQKCFVVFISLSIFLIFPEAPRELGNVCENYNNTKMCNIW